MQWPWVSRKRLEDAERRLESSEKERQTLLKRLFDRDDALMANPAPQVAVEEDSAKPVESFTTPFDRIQSRFASAGRTGIDPRFRVRMR